jgi:hypothetical protein
MTITGRIIELFDTVQVSEKFSKRELVVETQGEYPQSILIQFTQDKCSILDKYKIGQEVEVSININGRAWTNPEGEVKYFNSLNGWKISKIEGSTQATDAPPFEPADDDMPQEGEDDVPF